MNVIVTTPDWVNKPLPTTPTEGSMADIVKAIQAVLPEGSTIVTVEDISLLTDPQYF